MSRRIVIVEYYFTASQLLAFGIRSDADRPAVMAIDTTIGALDDEIARASEADFHEHVAELVRSPALAACIAPVLRWSAPGDLVCIVPSGALFYAPLHAVPAGERPLIARNAVFYAPSASTLRYCVRRRGQPRPVEHAAVFGNPEGNLTAAGKEAIRVSRFLNTTARLRREVTRDAVLRALASSDVFHFAGHGDFVSDDPLASGLVLANGELLGARDFFAVTFTHLRLVTLSGCVTGYNQIHPGDELLGLSRSLLHAGASSLLLTLWEIADEAGAELMEIFYQRWIEGGMMKADALREAQLSVYEQHPDDPSYWAPFVLVGDWV